MKSHCRVSAEGVCNLRVGENTILRAKNVPINHCPYSEYDKPNLSACKFLYELGPKKVMAKNEIINIFLT